MIAAPSDRTPLMTMPLSLRLREASRGWHSRAERAGVMPLLLRGQLAREGYVRLLRNLHAIYAALEPALKSHARHPALSAVLHDGLAREAHLRADLLHLHGAKWSGELALVTEATAYVERLLHLCAQDPPRLAAHAYVRYLGDLSGGQVLARLVGERFGLPGRDGLRFYDFGPAEAVAAQAAALRSGLDAMPLTAAQADAVVDEACDAFARHCRLFEQLAH
jgi:heme oxygenase